MLVTPELLHSYSAWLHFERRFLSWELCGQDRRRFEAVDGVVLGRNPGFSYHNRAGAPPSTRAAVVLSAVGCDWREGF